VRHLDLVVAVEVGAPASLSAGSQTAAHSEHLRTEAMSSAFTGASLVLDRETD
jgi:hypothetical protein